MGLNVNIVILLTDNDIDQLLCVFVAFLLLLGGGGGELSV